MKYEQVFIKSESDLPKVKGKYLFGWNMDDITLNDGADWIDFNPSKDNSGLIEGYNWYLQPLPEPAQGMPTDTTVETAEKWLRENGYPTVMTMTFSNLAMILNFYAKSRLAPSKENVYKNRTAIEQVREIFEPLQKKMAIRRVVNHKTYDFVVKHKVLIYQCTRHYDNFNEGKNDNQLQELITLARKEIGYSDKTWSGDIFNSLVNLYKKICVDEYLNGKP